MQRLCLFTAIVRGLARIHAQGICNKPFVQVTQTTFDPVYGHGIQEDVFIYEYCHPKDRDMAVA